MLSTVGSTDWYTSGNIVSMHIVTDKKTVQTEMGVISEKNRPVKQ